MTRIRPRPFARWLDVFVADARSASMTTPGQAVASEKPKSRKCIKFCALSVIILVAVVAVVHLSASRVVYPVAPLIAPRSRSLVMHSMTINSTTRFRDVMKSYPWSRAVKAADTRDKKLLTVLTEDLIRALVPFVVREPKAPINNSCVAPPLLQPSHIDCSQYPLAFKPTRRTVPIKVGHAIQFGFDVDTLEAHLFELYDVVDVFFLLEATHTQGGFHKKPLIWEEVKNTARFLRFVDKVVHIVLDDVEVTKQRAANTKLWSMEGLQVRQRWVKLLAWSEAKRFFNPDDIIGFGDADEVTSRSNIQLLKYCPMVGDKLDIGIWFPFGYRKQAFRSDYPVRGHPYSLGDPTFWTFAAAVKNKYPTYARGGSGPYLLGGMHMSYYTYLPSRLLRYLSCSECGDWMSYSQNDLRVIAEQLNRKDGIRFLEKKYAGNDNVRARLRPLDQIVREMKGIWYEPWFFACNHPRFLPWDHLHDTRLD